MKRLVFAAVAAVSLALVSARGAEGQGVAVAAPERRAPPATLLKEFDKDGDGKLNEAERTAMREAFKARREQAIKAREKEFDKNGDGKLDDAERAAFEAAQKAQMEQMMKAREKLFDKDGDGKLNDEERKEMMSAMQRRHAQPNPMLEEMMKRYDTNKDGRLSDEERKVMMDDRAKRFQALPPAVATNTAAAKAGAEVPAGVK